MHKYQCIRNLLKIHIVCKKILITLTKSMIGRDQLIQIDRLNEEKMKSIRLKIHIYDILDWGKKHELYFRSRSRKTNGFLFPQTNNLKHYNVIHLRCIISN